MKVRLLAPWKNAPQGAVGEVTPGRAAALRRLGVAAPVTERKKRAAKKTTTKENTDSVNGPAADDD